MSIMEVSLLTGFYPNQNDLEQLTSNVEMYAFQCETKTSYSDSTIVLYLEKRAMQSEVSSSGRKVTSSVVMAKALWSVPRGQWLRQDSLPRFLQAAQVTVYDYYQPSRRCGSRFNLPTEHSSMRKICHQDVCRCAEVYKVKPESVKASTSNPCIYYNVKPQAIIKSVVSPTGQKRQGTDSALALAGRKFLSHATCRDSLGLQEWETYIMGHTSDLWRVQSHYICVLGKETFLMNWPAEGDVGKKELLDQLGGFAEYMSTRGRES
ncbi:complement C3-like [Prionailurus bengalensis]|uniref:complement C3-like n=1 Tax=Prionailurus bengalensis TaxID=37029 RepID=UPI001CA80D82|nr:complement C3-like [Prionailurus bengalensis]